MVQELCRVKFVVSRSRIKFGGAGAGAGAGAATPFHLQRQFEVLNI
jgi:hypothetical protein